MEKKRTTTRCRSIDMPDTPPHKNLRKRFGTALVAGCLALSMCPTLALAESADMPEPFNANDRMMGQMDQMGQPPAMPQGDMQAPQGDFGGFMQQPPADNGQAPSQEQNGDANAMPQQPNQSADQNGQPPADNANGQQPGQDGQNQQPGQPGEMGQPGQQPGQMGQQPPIMPEQARELIERVYDILNIDKEANPIGQIMEKLGFGLQNAVNNMMGQPGQQPGQMSQPGQMGQQPGQPGNQGQSGQMGQPGQPGGMTDAPTSYDAANKPDASADGASYSSTSDSENAVLVDGKTLTLSNTTIEKTGDTNGESADFYGTNAAVLANNGANLTITDTTVTTNGSHANGVFSYGAGTSITISDSTITTTGNNSGGLMTTGGATLTAENLTVSTSGNSSAAIRTDRGGGTVTATQGSYSTSGVGSPAVYSTADITVSDATLSATNSEAVVIEGGNSVTLNNVNATGSNSKLNGQSTVKTNVLIYQSMSGDASEGSSQFTMNGGTLTSLTGSMFHVTNVTTTINLDGVSLVNAADSDDFLIATADAWGTTGKNGGHATVNLTSQAVSGNITVDSVSSVALNLAGASSYTGAIANDGTVNVTIEAGSTWTLTGDSYVTSLDNAGTINLNGHALYVNGVLYSA